jgi:hypothetical protein
MACHARFDLAIRTSKRRIEASSQWDEGSYFGMLFSVHPLSRSSLISTIRESYISA